MDDIVQYKQNVDKRIVDKALSDFGEGIISEDDLREIANFTVSGMKNINNRAELFSFLRQLSEKWTSFKFIATIEESELKEAVESEVYSGVLTLAQHGKIDKAIKLAKKVTS